MRFSANSRYSPEFRWTEAKISGQRNKILLVQPLNGDGSQRGDAVVALDTVDAGAADRVLVTTKASAP